MADSQLHITVTTDDEGLRGLIAKLNSGNLTIKEYNKSLRDLRASSKIGSQGLLDLKEVQTQVADATAGSQGKMMRSYFKTGEELRRFYREQMVGNRTMREATQTVGVFGTMLGGEGLGKVVGTVIGGGGRICSSWACNRRIKKSYGRTQCSGSGISQITC